MVEKSASSEPDRVFEETAQKLDRCFGEAQHLYIDPVANAARLSQLLSEVLRLTENSPRLQEKYTLQLRQMVKGMRPSLNSIQPTPTQPEPSRTSSAKENVTAQPETPPAATFQAKTETKATPPPVPPQPESPIDETFFTSRRKPVDERPPTPFSPPAPPAPEPVRRPAEQPPFKPSTPHKESRPPEPVKPAPRPPEPEKPKSPQETGPAAPTKNELLRTFNAYKAFFTEAELNSADKKKLLQDIESDEPAVRIKTAALFAREIPRLRAQAIRSFDLDANYYTRLGVTQSATERDITKAHRKAQQKFHSDVDLAPELRQKLEKINRAINEAYDTLSDEVKRSGYNRKLAMLESGGRPTMADFWHTPTASNPADNPFAWARNARTDRAQQQEQGVAAAFQKLRYSQNFDDLLAAVTQLSLWDYSFPVANFGPSIPAIEAVKILFRIKMMRKTDQDFMTYFSKLPVELQRMLNAMVW